MDKCGVGSGSRCFVKFNPESLLRVDLGWQCHLDESVITKLRDRGVDLFKFDSYTKGSISYVKI